MLIFDIFEPWLLYYMFFLVFFWEKTVMLYPFSCEPFLDKFVNTITSYIGCRN